jgi:hypothetical protein
MPPRRAPTADPPESIRQSEEEDGEAAEERRYEDLKRALYRKRRREEIEEMERELTGGRRAGLSPATSRGASASATSSDPPPRARAMPPPTYTAASLGELRKHIQGAVVYFDAIGEHDERRRVAIAASYCRDDALSQWTRLSLAERPQRWDEYEATLRNMVQDPANRMGDALLAIKGAVQGTRSIREFTTHLEELEEDVPPLSQEELRAWALVNGLRPELRTAVLREERTIRNRTQVVAAAQRLENLQSKTLGVSASHAVRTQDAGEQQLKGSRRCYKCDQEGHIARDCTVRATDRPKP